MSDEPLRIAVVLGQNVPAYVASGRDHDMFNAYFGPLLQGISDGLADSVVESIQRRLAPSEYLSYFRSEGLDGMIILATALVDFPILEDLVAAGVPYVAVGSSPALARHAALPCVDAANRDAGRTAAKHLMDLGHTRLACINLATKLVNHSDRMQGFIETVLAAGFDIPEEHLLQDIGYNFVMFPAIIDAWIQHVMASPDPPTGLFACDFNMAEALMMTLAANQIAVPDRVSTIGFDDPTTIETMPPPRLTTLSQPAYEMGLRSAQRLLEALQDRDNPQLVVGTEILPTKLTIRESTAPPPAGV